MKQSQQHVELRSTSDGNIAPMTFLVGQKQVKDKVQDLRRK